MNQHEGYQRPLHQWAVPNRSSNKLGDSETTLLARRIRRGRGSIFSTVEPGRRIREAAHLRDQHHDHPGSSSQGYITPSMLYYRETKVRERQTPTQLHSSLPHCLQSLTQSNLSGRCNTIVKLRVCVCVYGTEARRSLSLSFYPQKCTPVVCLVLHPLHYVLLLGNAVLWYMRLCYFSNSAVNLIVCTPTYSTASRHPILEDKSLSLCVCLCVVVC